MFSAYCLQNKEYFHTGRNSKSEEDCTEDIIPFLTEGAACFDEDWSKISDKEILEIFEVEVREHKEVM